MSYTPSLRSWWPDTNLSPAVALAGTSYMRGDGIAGWSIATDGVGVPTEDAFGMHKGTIAGTNAACWRTGGLPAGELSITAYAGYFASANPVVGFNSVGISIGNLNTTIAASDWYQAYVVYNGGALPALALDRFVNGAFSANMGTRTFSWVGGAFYRLGLNAGRTILTSQYSRDGNYWYPHVTVNPTTIGLTEAGFTTNMLADTNVPWFRIRVGAGQLLSSAPEGYLMAPNRTW